MKRIRHQLLHVQFQSSNSLSCHYLLVQLPGLLHYDCCCTSTGSDAADLSDLLRTVTTSAAGATSGADLSSITADVTGIDPCDDDNL